MPVIAGGRVARAGPMPARLFAVLMGLAGLAGLACLFAVCGQTADAGQADPFGTRDAVKVRSVTLPSSRALAFRGAIAMRPPFASFGGISGLEAVDGGLLAVSDRGRWLRIDPVLQGGRLVGARAAAARALLNDAGQPLDRGGWDAEDIAPGGWISFEGDHRIVRYDRDLGAAQETLRHPAWSALRSNGGLEGLARDTAGRLWAIAERSGAETTSFPVFVWDGTSWTGRELPRRDAFAITSASFAPDGAMYLIERHFALFTGFRTRIRRVVWGAGRVPERDEVLLTLGPTADNLEALAFAEIGGKLHLFLASDDNFQPLQRNVLALYQVMP